MEKTNSVLGSINTIKYLDHAGDYQIKTASSKSFKSHKYTYTKESMESAKSKLKKDITHAKEKLDTMVRDYQKLFIQGLTHKQDVTTEKNKAIVKIRETIDRINIMETVYTSMGVIPPHNILYTNHKIDMRS